MIELGKIKTDLNVLSIRILKSL